MKKMCKLFSVLMALAISLTLVMAVVPTAFAATESDYASTDYHTDEEQFAAIMSKYTGEEVSIKLSDGQTVKVKYEGDGFKITDMNGEAPFLRNKETIVKDENGNITSLGDKALDAEGKEIAITAEYLNIVATYADNTVTLPYPEAYSQGKTLRMKYIFDAKVMKEKYADYTFVLPFAGVDLTVKGSYFGKLAEDAERVEFSLKASVPFKLDNAGKEAEAVRGAMDIIKDEEKPHPVVGDYVFEFNVYVNNVAIYDVGAKDKDISVKINANKEQFDAAKGGDSGKKYNVYAYLDPSSAVGDETYDNMGAKIDEANATASFNLQNVGWFFLACDEKGNTEGDYTMLIVIIVVAAVVVIAAAVAVILLAKKKKKPAADAE